LSAKTTKIPLEICLARFVYTLKLGKISGSQVLGQVGKLFI